MSFNLTLYLDAEKWQVDILNKRLDIARQIYNTCLNELWKRYNRMTHSQEYIQLMVEIKAKTKARKEIFALYNQYGLSEYSLHAFVKDVKKHFKENIDANTAQKVATRCFIAFKKFLKGDAEEVHFKKYGTMDSVEGKTNKSGIIFKDNKVKFLGLNIPVIVKQNDTYAQMALELNKIKYCRILKKVINGKDRFYLQLVMDGVPPVKFDKETGEIKQPVNQGIIGIDIGTQTVAISSEREVKLLELAPEIHNIDKEKRRLQRKLDRSKRANNPDNYNSDGTIKKNTKGKWKKSKRYIKLQLQLREIQRKQADIRKQSHCNLANHLLSMGTTVFVEDMSFKGLQRRAKKTTVNNKGKINRKKRFGKSLANKAPAMFLSILAYKLEFNGFQLNKVNTFKIKASQYDHTKDEYTKKCLSQRWNDIDGHRVQRDMYSAFLLMNTNSDLESTNKEQCTLTFSNFLKLHNTEIQRLKLSDDRKLASMGI